MSKRGIKLDCYGHIPESNLCLDCGCDTHPGTPNRAEAEELFLKYGHGGQISFTAETEIYLVHMHVWHAAGMKEWSDRGESGVLCIGCLEKRIGRKLEPFDFVPDHGFNDPNLPGTQRRFDRLTGGRSLRGLRDLPEPPQASKLDIALNAAIGGKQWRAA